MQHDFPRAPADRASVRTPLARVAAVALALAAPALGAQTLKTGEQVYTTVCHLCHAAGVDNAPKFGNRKQWAPLVREGQPTLTAHAWVGVRKMPPRGGREELSLEEFARAVAYLARAAGGKWRDPDAAMLRRIDAEVKKREARLAGSGAKAGK